MSILSYFNLGQSKIRSLSKESDGVFKLFTKVQANCDNLNTRILVEKAHKLEKIQSLQSEVSTLEGLVSKNTNLSKKIEAFLKD